LNIQKIETNQIRRWTDDYAEDSYFIITSKLRKRGYDWYCYRDLKTGQTNDIGSDYIENNSEVIDDQTKPD
jgi:hypothetical protein